MLTDYNSKEPDDNFRSVSRKRKRLNCSRRSDCNLSNFGGPSSRKECHWTQVSTADLKHFLNMLSDPVIKAFHAHDTCCLTSDRYLLAMVFVYFKKAKLEHEEYNRLNFFKALYLAHEMEEENDENRWEILPWALGRRWQGKIVNFIHGKNEFWQKLDFRGIVPCRACDQVMTIPSFKEHSAFMRVRTPTHSNTGRILPDSRSSKHVPHGPVWQNQAGLAWLLRDKEKMMSEEPSIRNCCICYGSNTRASSAIARGWLNTDEMRESFFRAANILDPEWMQTNSSDSDGIRNISTIEAKGLDIEENLSQNSMRKHVDHLISQLATSPQEDSEIIAGKNRENRECQEVAKSSKKQDNNPNLLPKTQQNTFKKPEKQKNSCSSSDSDEDLFPNLNKNCVVSETERKNYALKRKAPNIDDEIGQHIDYAHMGRSKFDKKLQPKDIYEMLLADE